MFKQRIKVLISLLKILSLRHLPYILKTICKLKEPFKEKRTFIDVPFGLIIKNKGGQFFSHQTGGYAVNHPIEQGRFHKLAFSKEEEEVLMNDLEEIFLRKYGGWCSNGIDKVDAECLDKIFKKYNFPFVTDRRLLKNSMEAWIHIEMIDTNTKGVFIFPNSD